MALISGKKFSPKDPLETVILTFDFTNVLNGDNQEVIVAANWYATIISVGATMIADGKPALPDDSATMLQGSTSLSASSTSHAVTGGTDGNVYELSAIVTTSMNQTFRLIGQLAVVTVA